MCGICGFTGAEASDRSILKAMCDIMAHRGPDGEGQYLDAESGIALGHRRLSLIDLEGGGQPMVRADAGRSSRVTTPACGPDGAFRESAEDAMSIGRYAIVFNGEIYNHRDLRAELEADGWRFKTSSDTEVLLVGYLAWGAGVLDRLRGMFAFAVWDREARELFCARDFFGIKPFYYTVQPGADGGRRFIFASEVKSILEHPAYRRELNEEALEQYLCFQFNPLDETFFKGIFKLPAAHWLRVRADGSLEMRRYWRPAFCYDEGRGMSDTVDAIDAVLRESVRYHNVADVEVGSFLSSGSRLQLPCGVPRPGESRHRHVHGGIFGLRGRARRDQLRRASSPRAWASPTIRTTSPRRSTGPACPPCSGIWTSRAPIPAPWRSTSSTSSPRAR